jgi:hypothetical protein
MVRFIGAPNWWIGLQIQICINTVQGSDFPYLYCVLLAKPEANLHLMFHQLSVLPQPKLTVEPSSQADVDVIVVRQTTTKKAGYHTKPQDAQRVVAAALDIAQGILSPRPNAPQLP